MDDAVPAELRVGGVILAAGSATRFGGGKVVALLEGRPLVRHVIDAAVAASLSPIIVIVPPGDGIRGIDLTYTDDLNDLNPQTLGRYDVLLLYANWTSISPSQEKALLDYVAEGGGFVPIHCASYCFRNSAAYVALVGAQFLRHGTGEFDTKVVDAEHPIMRGLEPFRTWDETYVHERHNPDRHVLQVRSENGRDEPWSWVRTHGKGRVFYTALGHEQAVWRDARYQRLLLNAIGWSMQGSR